MGTVELARSLISFDTEAPPGKEAACARFIRDHISDLHMASARVELQEFEPGRANLVAMVRGDGPGLMLAGHMDVVPPGDAAGWRSPPFEARVRNGRLYGRGASDMKGGLAAMLTAVASLKGMRPKRDLVFVASAGEEVGFEGVKAMERAGLLGALRARFGVVGEPSGMRVIRAHKGSATIRVVFHGRSAHASQPGLGVNSIEACSAFVRRLGRVRSDLGGGRGSDLGSPLVTPTVVSGGTKSNVIPGSCQLTLDCRLVPAQDGADALAAVKRLLGEMASRDQSFRADGELLYETPSLSLPRDSEAVRLCESLTGATSTVAPYGTEASVYTENGIPTVVLGPGSVEQIHITDEYVPLSQLRRAESVYGALVQKVCL